MELRTDFQTIWVLVVITAALALYDVWAFRTPERGDTISEVLLTLALRHPVLPFLGGVLAGHFFWPQVLTEVLK